MPSNYDFNQSENFYFGIAGIVSLQENDVDNANYLYMEPQIKASYVNYLNNPFWNYSLALLAKIYAHTGNFKKRTFIIVGGQTDFLKFNKKKYSGIKQDYRLVAGIGKALSQNVELRIKGSYVLCKVIPSQNKDQKNNYLLAVELQYFFLKNDWFKDK